MSNGGHISNDVNKTIVRRFLEEGLNQHNLDAIDAANAPDFVDHRAPPGFASDKADAWQVAAMYLRAFPDLHFTLEDLIAEGDTVVARWSSRGMNQGPALWHT